MMKASSSDNPVQVRITLRDIEVLKDLYTSRYMTAPQIQALHWRENRGGEYGQITACRRRLRLLFDAGLIRRIEPHFRYSEGKQPLIYALDRRGAQVLTDQLSIDPATIACKPHERESNWPFLQHILDTTDARIAITLAADARGLTVAQWYNELELRSGDLCDVVSLEYPDGSTHRAAVVPDALFCLQTSEGKQTYWCVEIDKRTITVEPTNWEARGWMRKIRTYTTYFSSDLYKQRYGEHVVHVLTITTGEVRLAHLKEATEKVTTSTRFWFTTFDQLTTQTVLTEAIWHRARMKDLHVLLA
jgi:hypothetical protein